MAFGLINRSATSQLRTFLDFGEGFRVVYGDTIELTNPDFLQGWCRVPDEKHGIDFFINGIEANKAFTITQEGKQVAFNYNGDIRLFKQPFIMQMEIVKR